MSFRMRSRCCPLGASTFLLTLELETCHRRITSESDAYQHARKPSPCRRHLNPLGIRERYDGTA